MSFLGRKDWEGDHVPHSKSSMITGKITFGEEGSIKWIIEDFQTLWLQSSILDSSVFTYSGREYSLTLWKETRSNISIQFSVLIDISQKDLYVEFQLRTDNNIVSKLHATTLRHGFFYSSVCIDFTQFLSKDFSTALQDRLIVLLWVRGKNGRVMLPDRLRTAASTSGFIYGAQRKLLDVTPTTTAASNSGFIFDAQRKPLDVTSRTRAVLHPDFNFGAQRKFWVVPPGARKGAAQEPENATTNELRGDETDSDYESFKKLQKDFEKFLLNEEDSDITLEVQGIEFPAHRIILRARSPVFNVMFKHKTKETNSNIVTIEDNDPKTFPDFLKYLYTASTKHISQENVCDLYTTSDKYEVIELKAKCVEFMKSHLSVETFCKYFFLAHKHTEEELTRSGIEFFSAHSIEIAKTAEWQIFLSENPIIGNELFLKALSRGKNI